MTYEELAKDVVNATQIFISFFNRTPDMTDKSDVKELLSILDDVEYTKGNIQTRQK